MSKVTSLMLLITLLAAALAAPLQAAEMRGLWVDAFHPGFRSPDETSRMVSKAKDCGFNTLFVQVRKRGNVYYNSSIESMAKGVKPDYDPLADVIEKAHAAGLQVHAWIAVYEAYHDTKWNKADPRQVHLAHPDWLMEDNRGDKKFGGEHLILDPGLPEVQEYLASIVKEIASNYAVDGIHLDGTKYPSPESGYNSSSVKLFKEEKQRSKTPESEDEQWCEWRRAQVTKFVRAARQVLIQKRPNALLSAAVFPNKEDAYGSRFQDWEGWLKTGILDFAVPMDFSIDPRVFADTVKRELSCKHGKRVCFGQGGYRMPLVSSLAQIRLAREAGASGIVIYNYYYCSMARRGASVSLMDALKKELFAKPDTTPSFAER